MTNKIIPYIGIVLTSDEVKLEIQFSSTCISAFIDENYNTNIDACICLDDNSVLNKYTIAITYNDLISLSGTDIESIQYYLRHKLILLCESYINYEQQYISDIEIPYSIINDVFNNLKTQTFMNEISSMYRTLFECNKTYNLDMNTSIIGAQSCIGVTP